MVKEDLIKLEKKWPGKEADQRRQCDGRQACWLHTTERKCGSICRQV